MAPATPVWRSAGAFRGAAPGAPARRAWLLPVCVRGGTRSGAGEMAEGGAERADGRIVKMEVDYSATVDQRLPECERLAQVRGRGKRGCADGLSHGVGRARPRSGRRPGGGGTCGATCSRLLSPDGMLRGPGLGPSRAVLGKGRRRDCSTVSLAASGGAGRRAVREARGDVRVQLRG